jgi:uncharacterized protein (TIGR03435 family)
MTPKRVQGETGWSQKAMNWRLWLSGIAIAGLMMAGGVRSRAQAPSPAVRNATMGDFAHLMQSAVLDRPVVDQTGLAGKWDFQLKWTPDDSQFSGMGMRPPPPSEAADAPPPLFTAIQEQLGLKLESGKAQVDVMVIDHVEHPSAN